MGICVCVFRSFLSLSLLLGSLNMIPLYMRDFFGIFPSKRVSFQGNVATARCIVIGSSHAKCFVETPLASDVAVVAMGGASLGHCLQVPLNLNLIEKEFGSFVLYKEKNLLF